MSEEKTATDREQELSYFLDNAASQTTGRFSGLEYCPLATKKRIAGLRLVANDVAWSTGTGPEVEGPIESLILAMAGRRAGLEDLTGGGLTLLDSRM